MPKVSPISPNQCTLDDPTDGADLSSTTPGAGPSSAAPTPPQTPPCLAQEPGVGGATSECTDALVRNFGGGDGAGPLAPTQFPRERPCLAEQLSAAGNCGKVVFDAVKEEKIDAFNVTSCASSLVALANCEFSGD